LDVLILGPVPPPFGGIAVHVSRLVPLLQKAGLEVRVLNHFGSTNPSYVIGAFNRNPLKYYFLPRRIPARVVHYHHSHWSSFLAVALGKGHRPTRYVITLHGTDLARRLTSGVPLVRGITRWALNRFDAIIVVNPHIRASIRDTVPHEIAVIPAFLRADSGDSTYEPTIETFLGSGPTLVAPAFRVQFLPDGRELYGLDVVVAAFVTLASERPDLQLAVFIAEPPRGKKASNHLEVLIRKLEEAGLSDRALVLFGLPLTPALRHGVVIVRATRNEGDALSVREALDAGVPVVASDVVDRPPGTLTFTTDDVGSLSCVLRQVLDETRTKSTASEISSSRDDDSGFLDPLLQIYRGDAEAWRTRDEPQ
jgi:glycosyltransferase involved in cell wall biosynthesis